MMGISGAIPNQAKKQVKKAIQVAVEGPHWRRVEVEQIEPIGLVANRHGESAP